MMFVTERLTTGNLARPLAATKFEIQNPKYEYRILNKEFRMMKHSYPSTFIIPCSIFDIRFQTTKNSTF